jgi:uncharacterized protein YjeT (DUF2065 family)
MSTTVALILVAIGVLLVILGILYIAKPGIFQQGFWKSIDISRQLSSPEKHSAFMKTFGVILIVIGLIIFIVGMFG